MSANDFAGAESAVAYRSAARGLAERLRWRLNRLRCMSPAEVSHRVFRALSAHAQRAGLLGSGSVPEPDPGAASRPWVHAGPGVDAARYLAAADRIAAGRFDLFALKDFALGSPPPWNRDPKTGVEAPLSFGKLIDYRDPDRVGNIKYLWEINRHLHIVTLAQAYALSGEMKYLHVIRQHLESWLAECPHRMGVNWSSSLELGIRLINWSVAWQLLGGAGSPLFQGAGGAQFRRRWLESVFQHAQFIHGNFSLHSSANNHLIGEAAGLFVAALTWPQWPHARVWAADCRTILEREALLQNAADGVNREQAVSYQQFVLDLLLVALLAARANGQTLSAALESCIETMLEYIASIMDAGGNVPMFGDSDDAFAVRFAPESGFCAFRSLLATGAILFRRPDFKRKAGGLDDKTRWLLGEDAVREYGSLDDAGAALPVRHAFPEGGYYVLGSDFETEDEIRLIVDAGPLGYQTIAAHGHADALSFILSVGGGEFLIDSGTYAYHGRGPWRGYFRGTAAHNTVRVDRKDQSESGGNFMWLAKADAGCRHWRRSPERDSFEGWHDGYARLPDPVAHSRRIILDKTARRILVDDSLRMSGTHEIELFFHCSEECRVECAAAGYTLARPGRTLTLNLPRVAGAVSRVLCGSLDPIAGWRSRRFDEKHPAPTIVWTARLEGDAVLRTEIMC